MGQHVRAFVRARGDALLERLDEQPFEGADWTTASHGAVIRVRGQHDDLFERLIAVLPRPSDAPAEQFRSWAETRLAQLGWYLETCNAGKQVSAVSHDSSVVAVFMLRVGRDPNDPATELPPPRHVPELLRDFTLNVERYVHALGDSELRYVRALRLYRIPRHDRPDDFVLGVDVMPTVIGLNEPTVAISPQTLVRGVIGEFAELYDVGRELKQPIPERRGYSSWRQDRQRAANRRRVVRGLDEICAAVDADRISLPVIRERLAELKPSDRTWRRTLLQGMVIAAATLVILWLWLD